MFIIYSSPRSGSTFLKESLSLNSKILVPDETDFIIPLAMITDRVKDAVIGKKIISELIVSTERFPISIGKYLNIDDIFDLINASPYSFIDILDAIYGEIAIRNNASIAGDKTPNDLGYMGILNSQGLFSSNIKVIHLIRDVRDVALSIINAGWVKSDKIIDAARAWSGGNLALNRLAAGNSDRYLLVKYEELILNPQRTLKNICSFLEVDFQTSMMDWHKMGMGLKDQKHHSNLGLPPLLERCYAWKNTNIKEIESINSVSAMAIEVFGYSK